MSRDILVLNAGSSSIKFSIFDTAAGHSALLLKTKGQIQAIGTENTLFRAEDENGDRLIDQKIAQGGTLNDSHESALRVLLQWLEDTHTPDALAGVGHRIVHGGGRYFTPQRVTAQLVDALEEMVPLAPLHQPHNLNAVRVIEALKPELLQVACFDTAFHRHQPPLAQAFALPREYAEAGICRYGFHGLSYEYIASVLPQYLGEKAEGKVIVAHLGNGASMCAIQNRKSVATTMGFTALDGLPMGTRCGALDPGVILYLQEARGMRVSEVSDLLYHRSGLLGVSGISNDMRTLLASDAQGAKNAINLFVYRINRELGSLAAVLGGLDALIFTGGIGEHAAVIRERVCYGARWLGLRLDEAANRQSNAQISTPESPVSVWVIPTNEEMMIARHTRSLLFDQSQ